MPGLAMGRSWWNFLRVRAGLSMEERLRYTGHYDNRPISCLAASILRF
jgi:hypothetical protein